MYPLINVLELPTLPIAPLPDAREELKQAYEYARMAATSGLNLQTAIATAEATRLAHATDTPENREARILAARTTASNRQYRSETHETGISILHPTPKSPQ